MKMRYRKRILGILITGLLMLFSLLGRGGVVQFVGVVYDVVTYLPVQGKSVVFTLKKMNPTQTIHQQTLISGNTGEVISQPFNLLDSNWYFYSFKVIDCNNNAVWINDSMAVNGNDTIFLYIGICHSIPPGNCIANFTFQPPDTANPFLIHFTNTSTGNPTTYAWSFGDGTTSSIQNPVKQYIAPGAYLACLTISDSLTQCQHSKCQVVSITQGVNIQAAFNAQLDSFSLTPRMVQFTDQSVANIPLNHYLWSLGDGQMAQVANPKHTYQQSGTYQVCLTTGFAGGMNDSLCKQLIIPDYYDLWGQLFINQTTAAAGNVQLINPVYRSDGFEVVSESSLDTLGLWFFPQRIEHNYLLRAFPDPADPAWQTHLPTYPGNTIFWKDATQLQLNGNTANYNISLVKKKSIGTGICQVSGAVSNPVSIPSLGILVLLLDKTDGSPVAFTQPDDSTGYFSLDQLPFGSYILVAEFPGLETSQILIDLLPQNPTVTNIQLFLSPVTGMHESEKDPISIRSWPNPASTTLHLAVPSGASPRELFIYNTAGQQLGYQRLEDAANDDVTINISGLSAGVYSIMVNTKTGTGRVRFVKVE